MHLHGHRPVRSTTMLSPVHHNIMSWWMLWLTDVQLLKTDTYKTIFILFQYFSFDGMFLLINNLNAKIWKQEVRGTLSSVNMQTSAPPDEVRICSPTTSTYPYLRSDSSCLKPDSIIPMQNKNPSPALMITD